MAYFRVEITPVRFPLIHPFTIARGTRTHAENVLVSISADGVTGIGEAAPSARYGQSQSSAQKALEAVSWPAKFEPFNLNDIESLCLDVPHAETAAKAALESALLDWSSKRTGLPLWKYFGAHEPIGPVSSVTIGMDTDEVILQKLKEAQNYKVLKVKLGSSDDLSRVAFTRSHTNQRLWVDANEAWKTPEEVIQMSSDLHQFGVEFIEQPMPAGNLTTLAKIKPKLALPIVADEDVTNHVHLNDLEQAYDGINIKLMKTGSVLRGVALAKEAKQRGLKVLVGCMVESRVANTFGAYISLFADYADLDGHLLLHPLPFEGMWLDENSHVRLK